MRLYSCAIPDSLTCQPTRLPDLLAQGPMLKPSNDGVVDGLSWLYVTSVADALHVYYYGQSRLTIRETDCNTVSSRSHSSFNITLSTTSVKLGCPKEGTISFMDLAGSEQLESPKEPLKTETIHINSSLHQLSNCMRTLKDNEPPPFGCSTLTKMLKPCFMGDCNYVVMITNINQSAEIFKKTKYNLELCKIVQIISIVQPNPRHNLRLSAVALQERLNEIGQTNEQLVKKLAESQQVAEREKAKNAKLEVEVQELKAKLKAAEEKFVVEYRDLEDQLEEAIAPNAIDPSLELSQDDAQPVAQEVIALPRNVGRPKTSHAGSYVCKGCAGRFKDDIQLRGHEWAIHFSPPNRPYKCCGCTSGFKSNVEEARWEKANLTELEAVQNKQGNKDVFPDEVFILVDLVNLVY